MISNNIFIMFLFHVKNIYLSLKNLITKQYYVDFPNVENQILTNLNYQLIYLTEFVNFLHKKEIALLTFFR